MLVSVKQGDLYTRKQYVFAMVAAGDLQLFCLFQKMNDLLSFHVPNIMETDRFDKEARCE